MAYLYMKYQEKALDIGPGYQARHDQGEGLITKYEEGGGGGRQKSKKKKNWGHKQAKTKSTVI